MTDETKKLFDAPWKAVEDKDSYFAFMHHVDVCTNNGAGHVIAYDCIGDDGNRIARLPELYDGLMEALEIICGIPGEDACDHCSNASIDLAGPCRIREWRELLRKVRDGR